MNVRRSIWTLLTSIGALAWMLMGSAPALAGSCPNEQLRSEQGDQHLPDCRAYELVTPSDKGATTPLLVQSPRTNVAVDGSRVYLRSFSSFGENPRPGGVSAVMSRTASGWTLMSLQPPGAGETTYEPDAANPELTMFGAETVVHKQLFGSFLLEHAFVVGPPGGPYTTIATTTSEVENSSLSSGIEEDFLSGISEDGSRAVLASKNHTLAQGAAGTVRFAHDLYEWSQTTGTLQLVNVTSAGSLVSSCGAEMGTSNPKLRDAEAPFVNPMSSDGSKLFFTAPDGVESQNSAASCQEPHRLYMRVDGRETVEISAPEPGVVDPTGSHNAEFLGATLDGTHVWFMSEGELTADDTGHALQLYEYNTVTRKLVRVSRGEMGTTEGGFLDPAGEFVISFSEDGSILYFSSVSKLTASAPNGAGIYRYDTATGALHYVGPPGIPLSSSRDGDALVYQSGEDIFRYSTADERVICVSCRAGVALGGAPLESAEIFTTEFFGNGVVDYLIANGGNYVFFTTTHALVPQDTTDENVGTGNSHYVSASDVYEWESQGTGSCTNAEGCVSLISVPDSGKGSRFIGMSADGRDAFFETYSALVPQDQDTVADIYDVRIDGGFPAPSSVPCSGEGCRLVGGAAPVFGTPQSVAFEGAGNPPAASPEKMTVKHKTKVKKKKRKKKARKSHKASHRSVGGRKASGRGR